MLLGNRPISTGILAALYGFSHIWHPTINLYMKLRLSLLLFCLLGIGVLSHAQKPPKAPAKPTVENGPDAIPVTVTSSKKAHKQLPPPPPPPKVEVTKFTPPKIVKNGEKLPPPPPPPLRPAKVKTATPPKPDAPPLADEKAA